MRKLTLKRLYNTGFCKLYWKFLRNESMTETEITKILAVGLLLVNLKDESLQKLRYRLPNL